MKASQDSTETESGRITGILTAILLFICIVTVALYSYMKSVNPAAEFKDILKLFQGSKEDTVKEAQVLYSFEYESAEKPVFVIYNDYIAECRNGGIWFLDRKGQVIWSESIVLNNPVVKTAGSRLLAADTGSGEVCVIKGRSVVWKEKIDESILNADISESGFVTVITTSKRDNNEIRVYDPHGVELIRKIIANDFAVSSCIAPSSKFLAVSGISAGAAGAFSRYNFYDLDGIDLASVTFDKTGELLPLYWFNKDEGLFVAGDRALAFIDKTGKIIWEKHYNSVLGAAPYGTASLAAAVEADDGYNLTLYSASGQEQAAGLLEEKPAGMNATKGTIAVNTLNTVRFYNSMCKNTAKFTADGNIKQVLFLNWYQALVITDNEATVINIS